MKHPILSQTMTDYEMEFQNDLMDWLKKEFNPEGVIENMLVERIAVWCVKLFRAAKAEKEFIKSTLNPRVVVQESILSDPLEFTKEVIKNEGYTPQITTWTIKSLNKDYLDYEAAVEDRLYKTIRELERVQGARLGRENKLK